LKKWEQRDEVMENVADPRDSILDPVPDIRILFHIVIGARNGKYRLSSRELVVADSSVVEFDSQHLCQDALGFVDGGHVESLGRQPGTETEGQMEVSKIQAKERKMIRQPGVTKTGKKRSADQMFKAAECDLIRGLPAGRRDLSNETFFLL
jgi:hypothetical protein